MQSLFRQFVLKVNSRCDLACDHCYVYEHADTGWLRQPAKMAVETMTQLATRIGEHAKSHALAGVHVVLHGGEPLLCGPEHLSALIVALESGLRGACDLDLRIHTNGVLLDRTFCDLFRASGVKVGISLDGDRAANDRHRRYRDGRSSFDKVTTAIELLRAEYPELFAGLLCTIDVRNDPIAVYEALIGYEPPVVDLLLPHSTWDAPPERAGETDYADWLAAIVDRWLADGRPVPVRTFDSIISTGQGGPALTESLGLEPSDLLVVETDGTYEQADSLKVAFDGAPATGMNVFRHAIDEVARNGGIAARQAGIAGLCATCRSCPVVDTCGGGLFAHRYKTGSGFDNPSVFCPDLKKLIEHVGHRTSRPRHVISGPALRSIAGGAGGAEALAALEAGQRSIRRALVARVRARIGPSAGWDLLCRLDPAVDDVLAQPFTRAWAIRRLADPGRHDDGRLAAIAVVAAARAGLDARLALPVRDGHVHLPAVGTYATPGRRSVTVVVRDGAIEVEGAAATLAVRRADLGGLTVAIDDLDPFRDCYARPVSGRLGDEETGHWRSALSDAWRLIQERYPEYAPSVRQCLSTVVPLGAGGRPAGMSAREAFGAVAIALPGDAETLAELLVAALQRAKIHAVLDLLDLFHPSPPVSRDTERLLSGPYTRLAVARLLRSGALEAVTAATADIDRLLASDSLTRAGRAFAEEMRGMLD